MLLIEKDAVPEGLTDGIRALESTPDADRCYGNLCGKSKREVLRALLEEQGYLCAYCMRELEMDENDVSDAHVEHYLPQHPSERFLQQFEYDPKEKSLDYFNMLAVCDGGENGLISNRTCDKSRGNDEPLTVNPLDKTTVDQIAYTGEGMVFSSNPLIDEDLQKRLNLNCAAFDLPHQRKTVMGVLNHVVFSLGDIRDENDRKRIEAFCIRRRDELLGGSEGKKERFAGMLVWRINQLLIRFSAMQ